jgi:hypothetical protein
MYVNQTAIELRLQAMRTHLCPVDLKSTVYPDDDA